MVRPPALVLMALVLALPLSGCLGDDEANVPEETIEAAEEARPTRTTGSLTGQIITEDLELVVGATVELLHLNTTAFQTRTDLQGRYTINDVPSGPYRLHVSADCCLNASKGVDVLAAHVVEENLRMQRLTPTALRAPFMVQDEWTGFLGCSVAVISQPNDACATGDPNHADFYAFPVGPGIQELVVAFTWNSNSHNVADELRFVIDNEGCSGTGCYEQYAVLRGPPPLVAFINDDAVERNQGHFANVTSFMDMQVRASAGGTNVVYQQAFTMHTYAFYNQRAPEGFQPLPDG